MHALQDLATKLSTFSDNELTRLGIGAAAISALTTLRPMRASGARQRQIKYAAKLLQNEDIAESGLLFAGREAVQAEANKQFHALEHWRDRLIEQGDKALSELLDKYPDLDRQQLRQLIRSAQRERDLDKTPISARRLFKLLRAQLAP
jgi:ribosome-associated protein